MQVGVQQAVEKGLLIDSSDILQATQLGWRFLNETTGLFLTDS